MELQRTYLELARHSSVYAVGLVLSRVGSFCLLPLYTHYLRPHDYGVMAILDITANLVITVMGTTFVSGVGRYHFETEQPEERDRLWLTGLAFLVLLATTLLLPAWMARESLAALALGPEIERGGLYMGLMVLTGWFGLVGQLPDAYVRVRKRSTLYVVLSVGRLLLNISLNVYFIVALELGLLGVLLGNLIATAFQTGVLCTLLLRSLGQWKVRWSFLRDLFRFSSPLLVTALISLVLHDGDRYLLRLFLGMKEVGIYSLGYLFAQGTIALLLGPFASIWSVVIYEIRGQPEAERIYVDVFTYFVYGVSLAMLALALASRPIVEVMAADDYAEAAQVIPVVCLAYVFFSMHEHFRVPVMLTKRTQALIPVFLVAAAVNIAANLALIPLIGLHGAAWATVIGFASFSFFGLARYRRIQRFDYPLDRVLLVIAGMSGSYLAHRFLVRFDVALWVELACALVIWLFWAVFLLRRPAGQLWSVLLSGAPMVSTDESGDRPS